MHWYACIFNYKTFDFSSKPDRLLNFSIIKDPNASIKIFSSHNGTNLNGFMWYDLHFFSHSVHELTSPKSDRHDTETPFKKQFWNIFHFERFLKWMYRFKLIRSSILLTKLSKVYSRVSHNKDFPRAV